MSNTVWQDDSHMKRARTPSEERRKVAFVAHCLMSQNAKVAGFARLPGVVSPVIDLLKESGYVIEQLPCPELGVPHSARRLRETIPN